MIIHVLKVNHQWRVGKQSLSCLLMINFEDGQKVSHLQICSQNIVKFSRISAPPVERVKTTSCVADWAGQGVAAGAPRHRQQQAAAGDGGQQGRGQQQQLRL